MVEYVSGRTKSSACFVKITSTSAPACCNLLTRSTALYDAIPPQIPTTIRLFSNILFPIPNGPQQPFSYDSIPVSTYARNMPGSTICPGIILVERITRAFRTIYPPNVLSSMNRDVAGTHVQRQHRLRLLPAIGEQRAIVTGSAG